MTAWDSAASKLFGWTQTQAIGRRFDEFLSDAGDDVRDLIRSGAEGRVFVLDTMFRASDAAWIPVTLIAMSTARPTGTVRLVVAKRTLPPEAVQASRRLAAIVESSDDAIVSKDLNGIVSTWNRAAERMFGYTAEEMIGASIRKIIPDDRQAEEDATLATIRRGRRSTISKQSGSENPGS